MTKKKKIMFFRHNRPLICMNLTAGKRPAEDSATQNPSNGLGETGGISQH